jgi:hypothetical protein
VKPFIKKIDLKRENLFFFSLPLPPLRPSQERGPAASAAPLPFVGRLGGPAAPSLALGPSGGPAVPPAPLARAPRGWLSRRRRPLMGPTCQPRPTQTASLFLSLPSTPLHTSSSSPLSSFPSTSPPRRRPEPPPRRQPRPSW